MKILKAASAMFCIAAAAMVFAPAVYAQQTGNWDKWTKVTFSGPVEIPGVHLKGYSVLPAGTYIFRLLNSQTNRHIVQIQSEDQAKTYATILAVPNSRIKRTDETVITFRERPSGQPPALRAWFYPDSAWGDEFVYSKSKAKDMAKANNTPVLYSSDENSREVTQAPTQGEAQNMANSTVGAYSPQGDEEQLSQAVTDPTPSTQSNELAQNTPPANAAPPPATPPATPQPSAEPAELPQTAGNSGLLMLGGLLALGGAFSIRFVRQS
jgi:hypothetical protein